MSTAIIVPCRNEAGTINELLQAIYAHLKPKDSMIIVEGGSTDSTWNVVSQFAFDKQNTMAIQQNGTGKFDAVLTGIKMAKADYVMIWDADGTVSFSDNLIIYEYLEEGFFLITGDRLRGEREKGAMQFMNLLGNWAFAIVWGFLLNRSPLDSLCGTKKFPSRMMEECPKWLLRDDPYGDFAILGTAKQMKIKVNSIPVRYSARKYGKTNIYRWSGGIKLLRIVFKLAVKRRVGFIE